MVGSCTIESVVKCSNRKAVARSTFYIYKQNKIPKLEFHCYLVPKLCQKDIKSTTHKLLLISLSHIGCRHKNYIASKIQFPWWCTGNMHATLIYLDWTLALWAWIWIGKYPLHVFWLCTVLQDPHCHCLTILQDDELPPNNSSKRYTSISFKSYTKTPLLYIMVGCSKTECRYHIC